MKRLKKLQSSFPIEIFDCKSECCNRKMYENNTEDIVINIGFLSR